MATIQLLISRVGDEARIQVSALYGASEAQRERRIHAWTRYETVPVPMALNERAALATALQAIVDSLRDGL